MSGFNDPDKMRDALALARSFGLGKESSFGPGKESNPKKKGKSPAPPPPPAPTRVLRSQMNNNYCPPAGPSAFSSGIPPPSKRNYSGVSTFQGGDGSRGRAIGSVGLDFLLRKDQPNSGGSQGQTPKPGVNRNASPNVTAPNTQDNKKSPLGNPATDFGTETSSTSSSLVLHPENATQQRSAPSTSRPKDADSNATPPANILETFFSLVSRKPSTGQSSGSNDTTNIFTKPNSAAPSVERPTLAHDLKTIQGIAQSGKLSVGAIPSPPLNAEFENRLRVLNIARAPGAPRSAFKGEK